CVGQPRRRRRVSRQKPNLARTSHQTARRGERVRVGRLHLPRLPQIRRIRHLRRAPLLLVQRRPPAQQLRPSLLNQRRKNKKNQIRMLLGKKEDLNRKPRLPPKPPNQRVSILRNLGQPPVLRLGLHLSPRRPSRRSN